MDIAKRMSKYSDNGRKITPMSLCINLALASEPSYIERIMAACVVADFVLRYMVNDKHIEVVNQVKKHVHPFSILIKDNEALKFNWHIQKEFKRGYQNLVDMFQMHIPFEDFKGFIRKVETGRLIFSHITKMTGKDSNFLRQHIKSFMKLFEHYNKADFEINGNVVGLLTKKNIERSIKGQFIMKNKASSYQY